MAQVIKLCAVLFVLCVVAARASGQTAAPVPPTQQAPNALVQQQPNAVAWGQTPAPASLAQPPIPAGPLNTGQTGTAPTNCQPGQTSYNAGLCK